MKTFAILTTTLLALSAAVALAPSASAIPDPVCGPGADPCGPNTVACVLYPVTACVMDPCPVSGCTVPLVRDGAAPLLP